MRIGKDYQAEIPDFIADVYAVSKSDLSTLLWAPNPDSMNWKVDAYIYVATEKFAYSVEQALGLLMWHKYDVSKAIMDLTNYTPSPESWSVEHKVMFEQAFHIHGKNFGSIQRMLPDKSVGEIIMYYYTWKKTLSHGSEVGKSHSKKSSKETSDDEVIEESDSDFEPLKNGLQGTLSVEMDSNEPQSVKREDTHVIRQRIRCKPPRSIYLNAEDLASAATVPVGVALPGEQLVKTVETQLASLKRQVLVDKQAISVFKQTHNFDISAYRLWSSETHAIIDHRWTARELSLAAQGIRHYGRDFAAIAEVIGTKTESHVRNFYHHYRDQFKVLLQEHENRSTLSKTAPSAAHAVPVNVDSTASLHSTNRTARPVQHSHHSSSTGVRHITRQQHHHASNRTSSSTHSTSSTSSVSSRR